VKYAGFFEADFTETLVSFVMKSLQHLWHLIIKGVFWLCFLLAALSGRFHAAVASVWETVVGAARVLAVL
jgi:hypothetical protein